MSTTAIDRIAEAECPRCHSRTTVHAKRPDLPGIPESHRCWNCQRDFDVIFPDDRRGVRVPMRALVETDG